MYQRIILTIYILLTILLFNSCDTNKSEKMERIVSGIKVENYHYDLGKIQTSLCTQYPFYYSIQNITSRDVHIDSVEVSCSCLHIDHLPTELKEFQKDSIVGHIDVMDLKGKFSRSLYVNLNNGEVLLLRVTGIVE